MSVGKILHAKLFLEGIEVPLIGANIASSVNQPTIAYIDVVPHHEINHVKPRTMAHVFVRDPNNEAEGFPYVLAFEGEVFGINFSKSVGSRSVTLSCIDFSSYWDNVLTYFFNPTQSLGRGAEETASLGYELQDAAKSAIGTIPTTHSVASYFKIVIGQAIGAGGDFMDGLIKLYESITNINEFYNSAEDVLRISERMKLKSSNKLNELISNKEAIDWFVGLAGNGSGYQTLRDVINELMSILFHDFVSMPFPSPVTSTTLKGDSVITGERATIGEFIFKPNLYMLPPPMCNVFYPDDYSSFSFNRNFFQEPTRLVYQPSMPQFGQNTVTLSHAYAPGSFASFMTKDGKSMPTEFVGEKDLQVKTDKFGKYGDVDNSSAKITNNGRKKEQQFLTNEEQMKGILMSKESMVPMATQFNSSLKETGSANNHIRTANYLFFKKRFEKRGVQITSHLKMSVVPGFNVLILDDSDAGQNIVAYCDSVTHRIFADQGGYSSVSLSYARTADEQDVSSGKGTSMLIPPWFDELIFGSVKKPTETKNTTAKNLDEQVIPSEKLSDFYKELLGKKASSTVNAYAKDETMIGAVDNLIKEYQTVKGKGVDKVQKLINTVTNRQYVTMRNAFKYIGYTSQSKNDTQDFLEFFNNNIKNEQVAARKAVVLKYRDALKNNRGFRG